MRHQFPSGPWPIPESVRGRKLTTFLSLNFDAERPKNLYSFAGKLPTAINERAAALRIPISSVQLLHTVRCGY